MIAQSFEFAIILLHKQLKVCKTEEDPSTIVIMLFIEYITLTIPGYIFSRLL